MKIIIEVPENVDANKVMNNMIDACYYHECVSTNDYDNYINKAKLVDDSVVHIDNPIKKIDWELLKAQKNSLLNLLSSDILSPKIIDDLEGILSLIDSIQDYAVEEFEIDENKVFDLTKN